MFKFNLCDLLHPMEKDTILGAICLSSRRKELLRYLLNGPRSSDQIKTDLEYSSTEIMPELKFLREQDFIEETSYRTFGLTHFGSIIVSNYIPLLKTIDILEKNKKYWKTHDLEPIPPHLRNRLRDLGNYTITNNEIVFEPDPEFLENLELSRNLKGLSPVLHSKYPPLFAELAEKGATVSLILTGTVLERVLKDYKPEMQVYMDSNKTELYRITDVRMGFAVSEQFFSMGLFYKNGGFDPQHDVMSFGKLAIIWGNELYEHYLEKAEKITSL